MPVNFKCRSMLILATTDVKTTGVFENRENTLALEIHEKLQSHLVDRLVPIIRQLQYRNGCLLNLNTANDLMDLDDLLKNRRELSESLTAILGDMPLYNFFSDYISRILSDNADWEEGKSGKITDLPFIGEPQEFASKLVKAFGTLGWHYTVTYVLPQSLNWLLPPDVEQYVFDENTRLIRVTEQIRSEFPMTSYNERARRREGILAYLMGEDSLPEERLLFQTQVTGYIGVFGTNEAMRRAENRLKALIGFLISANTIKVGFKYISAPSRNEIIVYEKHSGVWEITRKDKIEDDLSKLLDRLEVNTVDGKISDDIITSWLKFGLNASRPGFASGKACDRLQLAAKWLVDSYSNNQELLGFVQAMVCLEIILGDQEDSGELGLGATIRNRCAYLIGHSLDDREEISEQLRAIYRVRSKIVHTGKDRFTRDDYVMLFLLRDYCRRALARELEIIAKK